MKNRIVELKDGKTRCRIIDTVMFNGNTMYLVVVFESKAVTLISPKEIWDIIENDPKDQTSYISIKDSIVEYGL